MASTIQYFYQGQGQFQEKTVKLPEDLAPDEVRIKPLRVGICGTDMYHYETYKGDECHLGHEWVGRVTKIGCDVQNFQQDDLVTTAALLGCGHCEPCLKKEDNFCLDPIIMGSEKIGALRASITLDQRHLKKLPSEKKDLECLVLLEVLAVAVQALDELKSFHPSPGRCLIMGAGSVGLSLAMIARVEGYEPVLMDISQYRLERAKKLGFEAYLMPQMLLDKRWQHQFNIIFDASGDHAGGSGAFRFTNYFCTRNAAVIIIAKYKQAFSFNPTSFGLLALKLHWIRGVKDETFKKTIAAWKDHAILNQLKEVMISHVIKINQIADLNNAFNLASKQGESGKIILNLESVNLAQKNEDH
jgi:threonine dehydrogenase-like Zn-dependent dehydrogenase